MSNRVYFFAAGAIVVAVGCAQGVVDPEGAAVSPASNVSDAGGAETGLGSPNPIGNGGGDDGNGGNLGTGDDAGTTAADDSGGGGQGGEDAGTSSAGQDAGGGGGTDAGGGGSGSAPTTCTQANGTYGCCIGNEVYYCSGTSTKVTAKACTSGQVCGWESSKGYYYCIPSPGGADPSGTHAMTCQ